MSETISAQILEQMGLNPEICSKCERLKIDMKLYIYFSFLKIIFHGAVL